MSTKRRSPDRAPNTLEKLEMDSHMDSKVEPSGLSERDLFRVAIIQTLLSKGLDNFNMTGGFLRKKELVKSILKDVKTALDIYDEMIGR